MAWSAVSSAVTTIGKLLGEEAVYLWGVKEQVDSLQTELKWMRGSLMEADVKQHEDERICLWVAEIREPASDAEDVIEDFALRVGYTHCRVVSISGMGGLGKTTLAKKLYHDSQVTSHFQHLVLVFVSQHFQTRKVWEDILSGFKKLD
ncbi:hypothetical protein V6N11_058696 [Hibiscus sabdariffa]|uniref:Disease resistance protein n=1 Tax=Hibiscus sabdariffa TaxID=183260 RepID=A0ABR2U508_9ROSI